METSQRRIAWYKRLFLSVPFFASLAVAFARPGLIEIVGGFRHGPTGG